MEENKEQKQQEQQPQQQQQQPVEEVKPTNAPKEKTEKSEKQRTVVEKPEKKTYGRKKRRPKITIGVREPVRKTIYDILLENLKIAGRKTFIHRLIYAGLHTFPIENNCKYETVTPITKFFKNIINKTNSSLYVFEKLTGFLMYYDNHFIHLVEGDEDAIGTHLRLLFESPDFDKFEQLKLFAVVNHINVRIMTEWMFYYGTPRQCVATLDISSVHGLVMVLYICIQKILKLIVEFSTHRPGSDDLIEPSTLRIHKESDGEEVTVSRSSILISTSNIRDKNNPLKGLLPEVEQLDILLPSDFIPDLAEYKNTYGIYFVAPTYKEQVWPIPSDFIPYDIFDTIYHLVIEFPKSDPLAKQENDLKRKSAQAQQLLEDEEKKKIAEELEEDDSDDEEFKE